MFRRYDAKEAGLPVLLLAGLFGHIPHRSSINIRMVSVMSSSPPLMPIWGLAPKVLACQLVYL
jgi:hypothetical protein